MMNWFRFLLLMALSVAFVSCNNDDDICISGEGTPRLKMMFKDGNDKKIKLDSLFIDVDYGSSPVRVITKQSVDSVFLPLRVDESTATELYVRTSKNGTASKIKLSYTTQALYVSPACGVKKLYKNLNPVLEGTSPVKSIEQTQTQITDENKTHLYLIF